MTAAKREDLRIVRTHNALYQALPKLLSRHSFSLITVNDVCREAQLSRTAFYAHFKDKYDLLSAWLFHMIPKIKIGKAFSEYEHSVNEYINRHQCLIKNLLEDASFEVLEHVKSFIVAIIGIPSRTAFEKLSSPRRDVLYSFCAGGVLQSLYWQISNKFPSEAPFFNRHFYEALKLLRAMETDNFQ